MASQCLVQVSFCSLTRSKSCLKPFVSVSAGLGAFVTPHITRYFINNYDWKFTMIIYGCMIAQCVVLGALMRPLHVKNAAKPVVKEM